MEEEAGSCHSHLRCAREAAAPSASTDAPMACYGITGFVCQHGVPLKGTFVRMPAPEQFAYYRVAFDHLRDEGVCLCDSYVDFNCTLGGHMRRSRPDDEYPADFLVPWLHARSHGPHCHLRFSGMYAPGARSGSLVQCLCGHGLDATKVGVNTWVAELH